MIGLAYYEEGDEDGDSSTSDDGYNLLTIDAVREHCGKAELIAFMRQPPGTKMVSS